MLLMNIIRIIGLTAVLAVLSFFAPLDINREPEIIKEEVVMREEYEKPLLLESKSACVFDLLKNEFIFELNPSAQLPLASLTKLMTAVIAKEYLLERKLIEISRGAILKEGDSGLNLGEMWKLPDLVDVMLISSSNDAAFAIADSLPGFVKLMNKKTRELGLYQTYFLNATGLDISENIAGAYGSCENITKLMKYILSKHPELTEATMQESLYVNQRDFKNTNKLLAKLPVLRAGKTGFDDLAGGNLVVAVDKGLGHPIIITVLGSSFDGRFEDVEKLYNRFAK